MCAHCGYATALLCEEINNIRPKDMQIIIPQIDARLWAHYHNLVAPPFDQDHNVFDSTQMNGLNRDWLHHLNAI